MREMAGGSTWGNISWRYTRGTLRVLRDDQAGAMPLASAVRMMLGWKKDRRRASRGPVRR